MSGLNIENTSDKLIMKIDKGNFSESVLLEVIKIARIEYLINKSGFDEAILKVDEEMKELWWQQNKDEFITKAGA